MIAEPTRQTAFPHTPALSCSLECREVHRRCAGCGVLEGPDHFHRLRDGFCYELLNKDEETGRMTSVLIRQSCYEVLYRAGYRAA